MPGRAASIAAAGALGPAPGRAMPGRIGRGLPDGLLR
jgi:hypothetical protein